MRECVQCGGPGTLDEDTLAVRHLLSGPSHCPRSRIVMGDFNVDILPDLPGDPWQSVLGRKGHHAEGREKLGDIIKSLKLERIVPAPAKACCSWTAWKWRRTRAGITSAQLRRWDVVLRGWRRGW